MNRRDFLRCSAGAVLGGIACARGAGAEKRPKPLNIVCFFSDDMGRLDTPVYGSKDVKTPTMEKLAARGMTFENAFVASPACAPSRGALLTGLMPARNGAEANHTYPKAGTTYLTSVLKALGYDIAVFGKVAHGKNKPVYCFDSYSPKRMGISEQVASYFEKRKSDKPCVLLMGDRRPHVPWIKESSYDPEKVSLPPYFVDTPETRRHQARYYTDITNMDADMGRCLKIARRQFGENFIFVFTSDHGGQWPFGKWNLYDAGVRVPMLIVWPGKVKAGVRTKAMVSWIDLLPTLIEAAGGKAPEGIDGKSFIDVLTGKTTRHREMIFTTHSGDGRMNVYPIRSVRTEKYKYIINLRPDCQHSNHSDILRKDGAGAYWSSWDAAAKKDPKAAAIVNRYFVRPAEELYDLRNDPLEQKNLAGQAAWRDERRKLRALLENWMKEQGDTKKLFNKPYPASGPRPRKTVLEANRRKT
ncbi:MAG: sulfatase [Phycisphaerae bacterium]|jgi:arylsulfatase A-like enzyme|nr:sulfatase [Phycisphaerae bacterium]